VTTRDELIAARDIRDHEWQSYRDAISDGSPVTMADVRRAFFAGFDFGENWMHGEGDPAEHAALVVRHYENGGVFNMLDELDAIEAWSSSDPKEQS